MVMFKNHLTLVKIFENSIFYLVQGDYIHTDIFMHPTRNTVKCLFGYLRPCGQCLEINGHRWPERGDSQQHGYMFFFPGKVLRIHWN